MQFEKVEIRLEAVECFFKRKKYTSVSRKEEKTTRVGLTELCESVVRLSKIALPSSFSFIGIMW